MPVYREIFARFVLFEKFAQSTLKMTCITEKMPSHLRHTDQLINYSGILYLYALADSSPASY